MAMVRQARSLLEKRLKELRRQLGHIERELGSHTNPDWEDLATERADDPVLEQIGIADQHEMRMIKAALARIDAGTYGTCTVCGEKIDAARLVTLPETPFCSTCAEGV